MPTSASPKTVRTAEDLAALPVGSQIGLRGKNNLIVLTKTGEDRWFARFATQPSITHTNAGAAAAIDRVVVAKSKRASVLRIGA